jgi:ADP-heptose:LPS heptosyltransferase
MPTALALRALGLGDFITGLPALQLLRDALPMHRIVLAAPATFQPLLGLGVAVDELHPTGELEPIVSIGPVDVAIDLHGNGPASRRLLAELKPRRLIGFGYAGSAAVPDGFAGPRWDPAEHEVARWLRLVGESFHYRSGYRPRAFAAPAISVSGGLTVVHPGAAAAARRWPAERFVAVIAALVQQGHEVAVTGSGPDASLARGIAEATGTVALTELSLLELFGVIARARLVVSGDTGVGHVASLYRTPSVLLFGPVSPSIWGPPADGPHQVLWHGDGTGDPHGSEPDPALLKITVEEVVHAVHQLTWRTHRLTPAMRGTH